jgi:hypothetical protein
MALMFARQAEQELRDCNANGLGERNGGREGVEQGGRESGKRERMRARGECLHVSSYQLRRLELSAVI